MSAYQEMIAPDSFPLYVLFIDLDPAQVDINVHPTKQEIKFEDEKIVYAFVQAAVKHALAQFSVTPTLEFDLDPNIQQHWMPSINLLRRTNRRRLRPHRCSRTSARNTRRILFSLPIKVS